MKIKVSSIRIKPGRRPLDMAHAHEVASSMNEIGQLQPIGVTDKNILIFGWHRLEGAKLLGWSQIEAMVLTVNDVERELAEIDENLLHKQLTALQQAESLARRKALYETKHPETKHGAQGGGKGDKGTRRKTQDPNLGSPVPSFVDDTVAKTGKKRSTVARKVQIGEDLDEKAKDALRGTDVEDNQDDLLRLARMDRADQRRIADLIKEGKAKNVREALGLEAKAKVAEQARANPVKALIHKADALDFLRSLKPQSIDLLATDPPYMTDVDDIVKFVKDWVPLALSRVKPTGRAYICTGPYPQELHVYLDVLLKEKSFTCGNVLVWTYRNTIGPAPKLDYKLNWQAIFHLRGPQALSLDCPVMVEQFTVQDINAPDGRLGDRYHAWQKPDELAERFIRHASEEGQLVVDPFAGTGSFLLAAARLGRNAVGCEIEDKMIKIARERGCELVGSVLGVARTGTM